MFTGASCFCSVGLGSRSESQELLGVYIYIDGSNFYHGCQSTLERTDVDLGKFAARLAGDRGLGRTYYYNVPLSAEHPEDQRRGQQRFFNGLARIPYFEVRLGRLVKRTWQCPTCGEEHERWMEKGVDMRLGVDMLSHASRDLYDVSVLVSGDGDYEHAVQAVKDLGKHVEVACFVTSRSDALMKASDYMHELDANFFEDLFLR